MSLGKVWEMCHVHLSHAGQAGALLVELEMKDWTSFWLEWNSGAGYVLLGVNGTAGPGGVVSWCK